VHMPCGIGYATGELDILSSCHVFNAWIGGPDPPAFIGNLHTKSTAQAKPSWSQAPNDSFEYSQSRSPLKPSQSQAFWARPGQNSTTMDVPLTICQPPGSTLNAIKFGAKPFSAHQMWTSLPYLWTNLMQMQLPSCVLALQSNFSACHLTLII
jgi:hypothetical protein